MITSISNPQIKNIIQLQNKSKVRKEQKAFIIEGTKMFEEAKKLGLILKVYFTEEFLQGKQTQHIDYLDKIQYEIISYSILKQISTTITPQGVIAIVKMLDYSFDKIIAYEQNSLILLENIRDPGNLGTIIRTAEGAGVTGVIMNKQTVDIYNPKVIRATMGSIYRLPFVYVDHFQQVIEKMKQKKITLYAADLEGKKDYDKEQFCKNSAIIIGNEANGITEETRKIVDCLIKIPMEGKVESLNAAVAAAILMYERYRQTRK